MSTEEAMEMTRKMLHCHLLFSFTVLTSVPAVAREAIVPETEEERLELLARARVWSPVDVASRDIVAGPQEGTPYRFGETLPCTFVEPDRNDPPDGATPKFDCRDASGDDVKIKYGADNGEVPAEIAASRLLWALGFAADRNFPVRVECKNCPADPWRYIKDKLSGEYERNLQRNDDAWALWAYQRGDRIFIPALAEKKYKGLPIERSRKQGWVFKELLDFSRVTHENQIHREALVLLLSILQHADNKAEQQRMVCPEKEIVELGNGRQSCRTPVLLVQDVGWTFGHGWNPQRNLFASKMELLDWQATPVWKDRATCRAGVNDIPHFGHFETIHVREESRAFLANLLSRLSRKQVEDIFRVARVDLQAPIPPTRAVAEARIQAWADTFETKRRDVVEARCPR